MTRFRVTWNGVVNKTIAIDTPADALYHIWSRFRDDFAGGEISIVPAEGRGVRLAQLSFPVRISREIEAENPAEAVRSFLYDDRVPSLVRVEDIGVEQAPDLCPVCGRPDTSHDLHCPRGDRPEPPYLTDPDEPELVGAAA